MSADTALLTLLQLTDGLFPAGGFAHSMGLETYVQNGRVHDVTGLEAFITAHLEGSAGPSDAVAASVASRLAVSGDVDACLALDARVDAMKPVPELRAASRQMGRQTLRAVRAFAADPVLDALGRCAEEGQTPAHHAVAFGVAAGRAGVDPERVALGFLYSTAALLVGAGVRLLTLGQVAGQAVLARTRPRIARLAAAAASATAEDMWSFTPALEIAAARHASLDARLFRS